MFSSGRVVSLKKNLLAVFIPLRDQMAGRNLFAIKFRSEVQPRSVHGDGSRHHLIAQFRVEQECADGLAGFVHAWVSLPASAGLVSVILSPEMGVRKLRFSLKPPCRCRRFFPARAHGMRTYEPREGRKAATAVCSASAVVTLAPFLFMIYDLRFMIERNRRFVAQIVNHQS